MDPSGKSGYEKEKKRRRCEDELDGDLPPRRRAKQEPLRLNPDNIHRIKRLYVACVGCECGRDGMSWSFLCADRTDGPFVESVSRCPNFPCRGDDRGACDVCYDARTKELDQLVNYWNARHPARGDMLLWEKVKASCKAIAKLDRRIHEDLCIEFGRRGADARSCRACLSHEAFVGTLNGFYDAVDGLLEAVRKHVVATGLTVSREERAEYYRTCAPDSDLDSGSEEEEEDGREPNV
jgi:hypothetical protein